MQVQSAECKWKCRSILVSVSCLSGALQCHLCSLSVCLSQSSLLSLSPRNRTYLIPHPSPPATYLEPPILCTSYPPYSVPPVPLCESTRTEHIPSRPQPVQVCLTDPAIDISSSALPPHTPRCFLLFLLLHQTSNSALLLPLNIFSTPSPYYRPGHLHQPTC